MEETKAEERAAAAAVIDQFQHYWISSAILVAANLGVADAVGERPREVAELARELNVNARSLHRLLRGLASAGVFREEAGGFVHTAKSAALRAGAPGDARATIRLFGLPLFREAMAQYEYAVRTGRPAFEAAHPTGNFYELLATRPEEALAYHEGMSVKRPAIDRIAELVDFSALEKLVDVGGGRGTLIASILARYPRLRGVLFDLPSVVAEAPALDRCEIAGGDMEKEMPAGADGYLLKFILHSRPDANCAFLLRRIGEAAARDARLFVIENLMPEGNDPAPSKLFDLFLLLGGDNGRVRTAAEHGRLLERAGFTLANVTRIGDDLHVLEARRRA